MPTITDSRNDMILRFADRLAEFDHAMLVTRYGGDLQARPMAFAECNSAGKLWFFVTAGPRLPEALQSNGSVNVAMQSRRRFLSISGKARLHRDRGRIEELWSEIQRVNYPYGLNDPNLVLVELKPVFAEYWDTAGLTSLRFTLGRDSDVGSSTVARADGSIGTDGHRPQVE